MGHSDLGPLHKTFPVALGCGKLRTSLINIKHVARVLPMQINLRFKSREDFEFSHLCEIKVLCLYQALYEVRASLNKSKLGLLKGVRAGLCCYSACSNLHIYLCEKCT